MFTIISWVSVLCLCPAFIGATDEAGPSNQTADGSSVDAQSELHQKMADWMSNHILIWHEQSSLPDEIWLSSKAEVALAMHKLLLADVAPLRCASMAAILRAYSKYLLLERRKPPGFSMSTVAKVALDVMVEQNMNMKRYTNDMDRFIDEFIATIKELEVMDSSEALNTWHDLATCLFEFGSHGKDPMIDKIKEFFATGSPRMSTLTWLSAHRGKLDRRWSNNRRLEYLENIQHIGGDSAFLAKIKADANRRPDRRRNLKLWPEFSRDYLDEMAKSREYPTKPIDLVVRVERQPEPDYSVFIKRPAIDVRVSQREATTLKSRTESARQFAIYFAFRIDLLAKAKTTTDPVRKIPIELAYDFIENAKVLQAANKMTTHFEEALELARHGTQRYQLTMTLIQESQDFVRQGRVLDAFDKLATAETGLSLVTDDVFNTYELRAAIRDMQKYLIKNGSVRPASPNAVQKYFCHKCLTEIRTISANGASRHRKIEYPECGHTYHKKCAQVKDRAQLKDKPCLGCQQEEDAPKRTRQTQFAGHGDVVEADILGRTEAPESAGKRKRDERPTEESEEWETWVQFDDD